MKHLSESLLKEWAGIQSGRFIQSSSKAAWLWQDLVGILPRQVEARWGVGIFEPGTPCCQPHNLLPKVGRHWIPLDQAGVRRYPLEGAKVRRC